MAATHRSVKHGGDEVVPDPLHLVRALISLIDFLRLGQDGSFWVDADNLSTLLQRDISHGIGAFLDGRKQRRKEKRKHRREEGRKGERRHRRKEVKKKKSYHDTNTSKSRKTDEQKETRKYGRRCQSEIMEATTRK